MVSYKKFKIIEFLRKNKLVVVENELLKELSGLKNQQSLVSFINSLLKYGILERAEKGKYLVTENLGDDFWVANMLYKPSYVSLETVLNLYGILSQIPLETSSVTTKRRTQKIIAGKLYTYFHLSPKYFFGFEKKGNALLALPEKALTDTLYFYSKGLKKIDIEDLDLSRIKKKMVREFAGRYPQTKKFIFLVRQVLKN